jgi:hypothetical protein
LIHLLQRDTLRKCVELFWNKWRGKLRRFSGRDDTSAWSGRLRRVSREGKDGKWQECGERMCPGGPGSRAKSWKMIVQNYLGFLGT